MVRVHTLWADYIRWPQLFWVVSLSWSVGIVVNAVGLAGSLVHASEACFESVEFAQASTGLRRCPRQFTGWTLVEHLETARYALALCQKDDVVYLVGHEKGEHEAFVEARIVQRGRESLVAKDDYGFTFEVQSGELKVIRGGQIVSREVLRRALP